MNNNPLNHPCFTCKDLCLLNPFGKNRVQIKECAIKKYDTYIDLIPGSIVPSKGFISWTGKRVNYQNNTFTTTCNSCGQSSNTCCNQKPVNRCDTATYLVDSNSVENAFYCSVELLTDGTVRLNGLVRGLSMTDCSMETVTSNLRDHDKNEELLINSNVPQIECLRCSCFNELWTNVECFFSDCPNCE